MELVAILRLLWRYRLLVAVIAIVADLAGLSMAYRIGFPPKLESRQYTVGLAQASALVDTPSSQIVDLGGETTADIRTLSDRATLLASLMTSSPIKDQIAAGAGVAGDKLVAVAPSSPAASATGAATGASLSATDPKANILKTSVPTVESGEIPIIQVDTQSADPAVAARLANQSIIVLKQQLQSVAGVDKVPDVRRLVVRQLGPAKFTTVTRGPGKMLAIVVATLLFAVGCGAIIGVWALVRGWRRASALEDDGSLLDPDPREPERDALDLFGPEEHSASPRRAAGHANGEAHPTELANSWLVRPGAGAPASPAAASRE